jgi:hypothetical protein
MEVEKRLKTWQGTIPVECDLCQWPVTTEFFDARTRSGRWGNLCRACWAAENGKLGTGLAQRYVQVVAGVWVMKETV